MPPVGGPRPVGTIDFEVLSLRSARRSWQRNERSGRRRARARATRSPRASIAAKSSHTRRQLCVVEPRDLAAHEIERDVGEQHAARAQRARLLRHDHRRDAAFGGDLDRVQRPGAAVGEQRELARDRSRARSRPSGSRGSCWRWRCGSTPSRRRLQREAERPRDLRARSPRARPRRRPSAAPSSSATGFSRPQADLRVGDRRLDAAACAYATGPGIGAGAAAGRP